MNIFNQSNRIDALEVRVRELERQTQIYLPDDESPGDPFTWRQLRTVSVKDGLAALMQSLGYKWRAPSAQVQVEVVRPK